MFLEADITPELLFVSFSMEKEVFGLLYCLVSVYVGLTVTMYVCIGPSHAHLLCIYNTCTVHVLAGIVPSDWAAEGEDSSA